LAIISLGDLVIYQPDGTFQTFSMEEIEIEEVLSSTYTHVSSQNANISSTKYTWAKSDPSKQPIVLESQQLIESMVKIFYNPVVQRRKH
jgi:hypothetical protein